MPTKSEQARTLLANHPTMTTTEIAEQIGVKVGFVSTLKWKKNNYDHWLVVHRQQARDSYHRNIGDLTIKDLRKHEAWMIAAYAAGMSRPAIAAKLKCANCQVHHILSHPRVARPRRVARSHRVAR